MIVGLKNASLVVVTTLVLIFSMATTFFPWEDVKKGGEISGGHHDASQKKSERLVDAHELKVKGEERHGIVVCLPLKGHQGDDFTHRHGGFLHGHG